MTITEDTLEKLAVLAQSERVEVVMKWLDIDNQGLSPFQKKALLAHINHLYSAREKFNRVAKLILKDSIIM